MSNKIVNSSAGNDYFTIGGSAISDSVQPEVNKGASALLGSDNERLNNATVVSDVTATGAGSDIVVTNQINTIEVEEAFTNTKRNNLATKLVTTKTATALRDHKWDYADGTWEDGYPENSNDTSATNLTSDDAATVNTFVLGDGVIPDETVI